MRYTIQFYRSEITLTDRDFNKLNIPSHAKHSRNVGGIRQVQTENKENMNENANQVNLTHNLYTNSFQTKNNDSKRVLQPKQNKNHRNSAIIDYMELKSFPTRNEEAFKKLSKNRSKRATSKRQSGIMSQPKIFKAIKFTKPKTKKSKGSVLGIKAPKKAKNEKAMIKYQKYFTRLKSSKSRTRYDFLD